MSANDQQDLGGGGNPPWGLDERRPPEAPSGVWVRATVDLPHLRRGDHAYVNPEDPDVEKALRATWLVPLDGKNDSLLHRLLPAGPTDIHDPAEADDDRESPDD